MTKKSMLRSALFAKPMQVNLHGKGTALLPASCAITLRRSKKLNEPIKVLFGDGETIEQAFRAVCDCPSKG